MARTLEGRHYGAGFVVGEQECLLGPLSSTEDDELFPSRPRRGGWLSLSSLGIALALALAALCFAQLVFRLTWGSSPQAGLPEHWIGENAIVVGSVKAVHHIRTKKGGKCLDWGAVVVKIIDCHDSKRQQLWTYAITHQIKAADGRCLDYGGAFPHVWTCGTDNQRWAQDTQTGQLRSMRNNNLCLEAGTLSNSAVSMRPCEANNAFQQWIVPPLGEPLDGPSTTSTMTSSSTTPTTTAATTTTVTTTMPTTAAAATSNPVTTATRTVAKTSTTTATSTNTSTSTAAAVPTSNSAAASEGTTTTHSRNNASRPSGEEQVPLLGDPPPSKLVCGVVAAAWALCGIFAIASCYLRPGSPGTLSIDTEAASHQKEPCLGKSVDSGRLSGQPGTNGSTQEPVNPAMQPNHLAVTFVDPRLYHPSTVPRDVGVCAFAPPGREEPWDKLCGVAFLSNGFDLGPDGLEVQVCGVKKTFRNAEAAFRALTYGALGADEFTQLSGTEVAEKARRLDGKQDLGCGGFGTEWTAMMAVLDAKFRNGSALERALIETGDAFLLNHSGRAGRDRPWSDNCYGDGANWLGMQLMLIRDKRTGWTRWTQFIASAIDRETGRPFYASSGNAWQEAVQTARDALEEELVRQPEERLNGMFRNTSCTPEVSEVPEGTDSEHNVRVLQHMESSDDEYNLPVRRYFKRLAGAGAPAPERAPLMQAVFGCIGCFVGVAAIGLLHASIWERGALAMAHLQMISASFGGMAAFVFSSAFRTPLSQPKNIILGNTIGGFVSVSVVEVMNLAGLENETWLSGALAVALTLAAQELSTSVQPAGGVTALCYVLISPMQRLSYVYVLCPAFLGSVVMVTLGMLVNNVSPMRIYPQGWWFDQEDVLTQRFNDGPSGSASLGYFAKFAGAGVPEPPRPSVSETGFSFFGSFTTIAVAGLLEAHLLPQISSVRPELFIGTLGASAVTIFGASNQPEAQPRVALLGSAIGGFMGLVAVTTAELGSFGQMLWLTGALAVSGTVLLQEVTVSVHPAGADLALFYVIRAATAPANPDGLHDVDIMYLLCPCLLGTLLVVLVGMVINNLSKQRAYPQSWC